MKYIEKLDKKLLSYSPEFDELLSSADCLYKLSSGHIWTEGPAYIVDTETLIFSDVKDNKMHQYSPSTGTKIYREYSNYANGNSIDAKGRLVTCEHGRRCISRTDLDGRVTVLADKYEGRRFNSPNDVVVKSDQSIWFSDPPYGIISDHEGYKAESQIIGCYVYRLDTDGGVQAMITDTQRPNGLAFSPNEEILYVADMSIVDFPTYGRRHIRAYDMKDNQPVNGRNFVEISPGIPDGFRVDKKGRLYVSFEHGIKVFHPSGECLGEISIPERVSNCCFAHYEGAEYLFVTATSSLYGIEIKI